MKIAHYIDTFSHLSETFVFDLLCALRDDDLARESQHFVICHQRRNEQSRPFDGVQVVGFGSPKNVFGKLLQKIGVEVGCPNEEAVAKLLLTNARFNSCSLWSGRGPNKQVVNSLSIENSIGHLS